MIYKEKAPLTLPDKSGYMKVKKLSKETRHIKIKDLVRIDEKQYRYLIIINSEDAAGMVGKLLKGHIQKGILHITGCKYGMKHLSMNICETVETD